jgi:hypothetical protein
MQKKFHLEFFIFSKMLDTQNQTVVKIAYVHINVIAPLYFKKHFKKKIS